MEISLPIRRRWLCREGGQAGLGKNLLDRGGKNGRSSNDASVRLASRTVSLRHTPSAITNRPDPGKNGLAVPNANLNRDARFLQQYTDKSPFSRETLSMKPSVAKTRTGPGGSFVPIFSISLRFNETKSFAEEMNDTRVGRATRAVDF